MPFAVSRRALDDRIVIRDARLLRCPRDAVDIRDECDHRFARTVGRRPRGRNARNTLLDLETVLREDVSYVARSLEFLESEFRITKNLVDHLLRKHLSRIHLLNGVLL